MWTTTSAEVYAVIMAKHGKEMTVHSSYSDPTGNRNHFSTGMPEMITEWGFKNADFPLIKIESKKEHEEIKEWNNTYYIAINQTEK